MQTWRKGTLLSLALWGSALVVGYFGYNWTLDRQFAQAQEQREKVREGLSRVEDIASAFRSIGKLVEPSVVQIEVHKKAHAGGKGRVPFGPEQLRRFFPDRDGDGQPDLPPGMEDFDWDSIPEQQGTGSGVIMEYTDGKGYILTNNHVAGGAESMTITLNDGRKVTKAKLLGADAKTDLAVVQIEADRLVAAKWGNSEELQKGDWIMAFGSPFGFIGSMTHGIVSALHRTDVGILGNGGYENFIQVDAPINPGNSGGPLVNLRGEVVGVNTAIASQNGGFQGIGFAIPSEQAKTIYATLKEKGKVVRGWLGVSIQDVAKDPDMAQSFGYKGEKGVLVQEILPGTPAVGRLQNGDIITRINGKPADDVQQLRGVIANMPPGQEVTMEVFRGGKMSNVTIKLGEQPEDLRVARGGRGPDEGGAMGGSEALGIGARTLTEELAQRLELDVKSGAVIERVERNSAAAKAGLRAGDVITEVGGQKIKTAADLSEALKKADLKKGVRLYVSSQAGSRFVFIKSDAGK
jgi:serine protease Do